MVNIEVRREQKRLANRRWMKKYPGRAALVAKNYRDRNPHMYAITRRKWLYGLTKEEFESRIKQQDNKCAICLKEFTKTPSVDHDHNTDKVRDLLCSSCNLILGHAHDDIRIL